MVPIGAIPGRRFGAAAGLSAAVRPDHDPYPGGWTRDELHRHVRTAIEGLRRRVAPRVGGDFDELVRRRHLLSEDPAVFFHPLGQPLAQLPLWVAEAVGVEDRDLLLDLVEASVIGYLYVRVHDDVLDEGLGDPTRSMFLADAFLVRHQSLVARHVGSAEFWSFFEQVANDYSEAMLLEREAYTAEAVCDEEVFDRVLDRSRPLVIPGATLLSIAGRWDLLSSLERFVRHTVKAGQLVDDTIDAHRDLERGNHTWVVRLLGGLDDPGGMGRQLLLGGIDDIVVRVHREIDAAKEAAREVGMPSAERWLGDRASEVEDFKRSLLLSIFEG